MEWHLSRSYRYGWCRMFLWAVPIYLGSRQSHYWQNSLIFAMLAMRQLLKISLLLIYVFFNAGLSYSMHFCGQELKDINWLAETTPCCPAEEGEEDCCEDIFYSEIHATDQQSKQSLDFQFVKFYPEALPVQWPTHYLYSKGSQADKLSYFYQQHLSPRLPAYIVNQVFLI